MCGRDQWMPLIVGSGQEAGIPVFHPTTRRLGGYVDAASLTCENCGFIRLHSLQALKNMGEGH